MPGPIKVQSSKKHINLKKMGENRQKFLFLFLLFLFSLIWMPDKTATTASLEEKQEGNYNEDWQDGVRLALH